MVDLTLEVMQRRWPHGDQHVPGLIEGIVAAAPTVFPKYGLDTPLVIAHAMAQFSEECGQGLEMIENMNYSEAGLLKTFPTHFTATMAQNYAHNPRMIADIAYGGRMGNAPPPSDDGFNFRGRGLSQVTGREGYTKLQNFLTEKGVNIDILTNPELISDPHFTLECGVADYILCGCLPHAEADDIIAETKALNGGLNGLAERERQLALWKRELLGGAAAGGVGGGVAAHDTKWVQGSLNQLGANPPLNVDGQSGPATQAAIRSFQQKAGLPVDGVAGPQTIAAIEQALAKG
jgi:putative chitinase